MANFGMVSDWHRLDNMQEIDAFCKILKPGDIVQIENRYSRYMWAICTQDGNQPKMVHNIDSIRGSGYIKSKYQSEMDLDDMSKDDQIRINNSRDKITPPKPRADIVRCAKEAFSTTVDWFDYYKRNTDLVFVENIRYPKDALNNRLDKSHCTQWFTAEALESFLWLLRPGDMVQFNRKNIYSHWAVVDYKIMLKHNFLIHRYGSGNAMEVVKKLIGKIRYSPIHEVIKGSRFRINNSWDKKYTPKDPEDIEGFAFNSIGSNAFGTYDLFTNNCWHFAMQVRYRVNVSNNIGLRTQWYTSLEDIQPVLYAGDIIVFEDCLSDSDDDTSDSSTKSDISIGIDRLYLSSDSQPDSDDDILASPSEEDDISERQSNEDDDSEESDPVISEMAIYIERAKFRHPTSTNTREVAYLSLSDDPDGKYVVRVTSVDDFFNNVNVVRGKRFCIDNTWDRVWEPQECKNIVKSIEHSIGKYEPYFIVDARYGQKASEEVRGKGGVVSKALDEIYKESMYAGPLSNAIVI